MTSLIYGTAELEIVELEIVESDPLTGKPYLQITFADDVRIGITTNLAEMIGDAGRGARLRWEDINKKTADGKSK